MEMPLHMSYYLILKVYSMALEKVGGAFCTEAQQEVGKPLPYKCFTQKNTTGALRHVQIRLTLELIPQ